MRHRSRLRDGLEYGLAVLILNSLAYTPLSLANWLARGYVRLLDLALPRLRRVAMRNLAMALPNVHKDDHIRIAGGGFRTIASLLVSFARFPRMNRSNIGDCVLILNSANAWDRSFHKRRLHRAPAGFGFGMWASRRSWVPT